MHMCRYMYICIYYNSYFLDVFIYKYIYISIDRYTYLDGDDRNVGRVAASLLPHHHSWHCHRQSR